MKQIIGIFALMALVAGVAWYFGTKHGDATPDPVANPAVATAPTTPAGPNPVQPPMPPPLPVMPGNQGMMQDQKAKFLENQAKNRDAMMLPYATLMTELGFDEATRAKAVAVIKEFQTKLDEGMAETLATGKPPALETMLENDKNKEKKLKEALGESAYKTYQANVDTIPERMALSSLENKFDAAGMSLTDAQANEILTQMTAAARAIAPPKVSLDPNAPAPADGTDSKQEAPEPFDPSKRFEVVSDALRKSSSTLTVEQQAVVDKFIKDTTALRSRMSGRRMPR